MMEFVTLFSLIFEARVSSSFLPFQLREYPASGLPPLFPRATTETRAGLNGLLFFFSSTDLLRHCPPPFFTAELKTA